MVEKKEIEEIDYTLKNPETLTKYKNAAQISQKVLEAVSALCVAGEKIVTICEKGDQLLNEELSKVYRGKKITKGISHPTTVSPSPFVTPFTPLSSDEAEASITLKEEESVKIQLGAQIDGFGTIVCDTIIIPSINDDKGEIVGRKADLVLANYYANEVLLRLMIPPGLLSTGNDEEKAQAAKEKPLSQSKITQYLEKVVKSFDCNLVEQTTSWQFERNEIEGKKKLILAGEGAKSEGVPEVNEVWGVEVGVSLGSGKVKNLENRATLHRRTNLTYALKRPSSKKILNEVVKKFGVFPFSLRQLEDERDAKVGVVECVRGNVFRQYDVIGTKDGEPVARTFTTIAITKNGLQKLASPPQLDISKFKTEKKITDEEILKILDLPLVKESKLKNKTKKKSIKKITATGDEEDSNNLNIGVVIVAATGKEREGDRILRAMSSLNTRPTRSRLSNNLVTEARLATVETSDTKLNKSSSGQTVLDGWVEPAVPPQRPSYADAGIERHGVVQNMAPLGSRPSLKVLKAAALLEGVEGLIRPVRHRKNESSNSSAPARSILTPELSETATSDASQSLPEYQREKNPSFEPKKKQSSLPNAPEEQTNSLKNSTAPTALSHSFGHPISEIKQVVGFTDANTSDSEISRLEFSQSPIIPPRTGQDGLPLVNLAQTDRVVELAVQNAIERKRWPTAYALRTLYDDNRGDISFVRLLEAVYYNYATEQDLDEFERLLKPKKFEGRKDRTGELYFNGDGNNPPTLRPIFSAIEALNPPAPAYVTPYNSLPSYKSTSALKESSKTRDDSPIIIDVSNTPSPSLESKHIHKKSRTDSYFGNNSVDSNSTSAVNSTVVELPPQTTENEVKLKSRSCSLISSSSLSSVDVNLIEEVSVSPIQSVSNHGLARLGLFGAQPAFISPYASANNFKEAASSADSEARSRAKLSIAPQKPGPKIHTFSVSSSSNNTISSSSNIASEKLSGQLETVRALKANSTKNLDIVIVNPSSKKKTSKVDTKVAPYDVNDEHSIKRRNAKELTNSSTSVKMTESFERMSSQLSVALERKDPEVKTGENVSLAPNLLAKRIQKVRLNHNTPQRITFHHEGDSINHFGLQPDGKINSSTSSPISNPSYTSSTVKKNSNVTGLRTKSSMNIDNSLAHSPIKKKPGTSAEISKANNDRSSHVRNNNHGNNDDNDDFCASCGGNGEVVCCDGESCKRSFHFKCVDPPMMPDSLPEIWFCNECQGKQTSQQEEKSGPFGLLLLQLEGKNPGALSLPSEIRGYFEGVKTGPNGEYEEIVAAKPKATNRNGWEETPDYFRKRDNKGKPILCHSCGLQAEAPDRVIIPCSFCNLYWHLDCVDMPLAKEPAPGRLWQCQAHVDDLLRLIPSSLGPAHRFRKIKGVPLIHPEFSRGLKNHGHIEIDNDPTDEEADSNLTFYEERPFGRIAKISEQSIKLDFLLKVKREGGGYTRARFSDARKRKIRSWSEVNLSEQQAALNLTALANSDPSLKGLNNLISALLVEAPPNVINMIAQGDAENLASDRSQISLSDRKSLMALKILIDKRLSYLDEPKEEEPFRKKLRKSKRTSAVSLKK
ncbi:putative phd-finger domain-containing protein [Golovinomyces cichoracearum]|uniref:Putative phd-finger domain-containing protein n=1 Tax=Golovinomyces cichoracearum TaxID=62708 RepID=A0A420HAG3_9PEZI|nr:putative phd-finger domain-containing protein [Golovinomyces cichoracearum]